MEPTAEMRWFGRGQALPQLVHWFEGLPGTSTNQIPRIDYYLALADSDDLGVKIREGRIECKQLLDRAENVIFSNGVTGLSEQWRKWGLDLGLVSVDTLEPSLPWLPVWKQRTFKIYRLLAPAEVTPVRPWDIQPNGCVLELTALKFNHQGWWSLGFEAFGPESELPQLLDSITSLLFTGPNPGGLTLDNSFAYPHWLCQVSQSPDG